MAANPRKVAQPASIPFKVGRKTFVGGMFWQTLEAPRRPMQDAQKIARRDRFDLVVIRKVGNTAQAGFIRSARGLRAGAYSVAAVLAARLGRNFIGVFALDDGRFLLCAVRDGTVLPGCDVLGGAAEIHPRFIESLDLSPTWDAIYLPANFERPEGLKAQESHLSKILASRVPASARLNSPHLRVSRSMMTLLLCLAGGMLGWWATVQWSQSHQGNALQTALKPAQAAPTQSAPALTHPWAQQVRLQAFLNRCMAAMHDIPLSLAGWSFEQAQCRLEGAVLTAGYKRQGRATARQFVDAAKTQGFENPMFKDDFNSASLELPLKWAQDDASDEPILAAADRQASFASNLQALGISFKLQDTAPITAAPALPGGAASAPVAPGIPPSPTAAAWHTYQWSFETKVSPTAILAAVDDKGLRVTDLKVVMHAGSEALPLAWSISGVMYAQP